MELKRIRHERDEAKRKGQQQPAQQPDAKRMRHNHGGKGPNQGQGQQPNARAAVFAPGTYHITESNMTLS